MREHPKANRYPINPLMVWSLKDQLAQASITQWSSRRDILVKPINLENGESPP